jgi:acetyl esterase/lipase
MTAFHPDLYPVARFLPVHPGLIGYPCMRGSARREDLSGLPATWLGVGSFDLFHDEDMTYAQRLTEAGVACELCAARRDETCAVREIISRIRQKFQSLLEQIEA